MFWGWRDRLSALDYGMTVKCLKAYQFTDFGSFVMYYIISLLIASTNCIRYYPQCMSIVSYSAVHATQVITFIFSIHHCYPMHMRKG